jgi:pimeloyl-ACP methyl ester carboxylesterase
MDAKWTSAGRRMWGMAFLVAACAGCSQTMPDRAIRMTRGYVYYCDGAGGGGFVSNWSRGIRDGFINAGYEGAGEIFRWNTGMGVLMDQIMDDNYKGFKARQLANEIRNYTRDNPKAPVTVMGLSAGTAIAVFALEALPEGLCVENVILLGASIAANHDMSRALRHVRNRLYIFTSDQDPVLKFMVPMVGTADRQDGTVPSAGLEGFQLPRGASAETRRLYSSKIVRIAWTPAFERYGYVGGHTDVVNAQFVRAYIAPLVIKSMTVAATTSTEGKVRNPDYERWARYGVGTTVTFEGYQVVQGVKQGLRVTVTLASKHKDVLLLERNFELPGDRVEQPMLAGQFYAHAMINPDDHPFTSPKTVKNQLPNETITIRGKAMECGVMTVQAGGNFPEWGSNVSAKVYQNPDIPGGMARIWLKTYKKNQQMEMAGDVVDYKIVSE